MIGAAPRALARLAAAAAALGAALSACDRLPGRAASGLDKDRLEAALDPAVGGPDTCVVIKDVAGGQEIFRYGAESVCNRPLPPCGTFQIPLTVIALSDGRLKPEETRRWTGEPQLYKAWERDMDLADAWRTGGGWYFQALARDLGPDRFRQALSAFDYGQGEAIGRPDSFWMGPAAGGGLFLSTRNQADILRKLAQGQLPAKPEAQQAVQALMADVTRGQTRLYDLGASCSAIADASRDVSWWVGRIQGPERDLVFALSIDSQNPLSGREIRSRMLPILTRAGLLPSG